MLPVGTGDYIRSDMVYSSVRRSRRVLLVLGAIAIVIAAIIFWARAERTPQQAPVVLAAASLQESLEAAAQAWSAQGHPRPVLSFAATSALARQIEAGAPADLFISADEEWMDTLAGKDLIQPQSRATMVGNRLVLIAAAKSTAGLDLRYGAPLAPLLGTGRLALADPEGVPAGRYAKQALTRLGMWDQVASRIAAGSSVRAALSLVAGGEAPLGIVYATDAAAEPRVRVIATFPTGSHAAIRYPLALLKTARSADAEAFHAFLLSPEGQAVFRRFGFTLPD
jgi:molybdate transport system substrate-binding protein